MKKQIILYFGAMLITFLTVFIKNLSSGYYPITSTFGIEGNKISYRLDKIHYGDEPLFIGLLTDLNGIEGKVMWEFGTESGELPMNYDNKMLFAEIISTGPMTKIDYKIILRYNDQEYQIPRDGSFVTVEFYGSIPKFVLFFHYLLLFAGIFFAVRAGLDFFDENKKTKKFSVIVLSTFLIYGFFINPLKNSYKIGAINESIPELASLFDLQGLLFAVVWIAAIPFIFNKKFSVPVVIVASVITIIIFICFPFVV